MRRSDQENV